MRAVAVLIAVALVALPAGADARKRHRTVMAKLHAPRAKGSGFAAVAFRPVGAAPAATPAPVGIDPDPTPAPSATPAPAPTTVPPSNPHSVSVRGTEYALSLSQKTVDPGELKVQFDLGRAEDAHSLSIDGPDPDYWSFDEQDAGTVKQHTITVHSGSYVLFCPLPQHEALGMRTTLTVR